MSLSARAILPVCLVALAAGCDAPILPGSTGGPPAPTIRAGVDATPADRCRVRAANESGFDVNQITTRLSSQIAGGTVYDVNVLGARFSCTVADTGAITRFVAVG